MAEENLYDKEIEKAVSHFWDTRNKQQKSQKQRGSQDQGNRSAVTGGKQLDGFIKLMKKAAEETGIPGKYILTKGNYLPGYFRPTKNWDLLILSPS